MTEGKFIQVGGDVDLNFTLFQGKKKKKEMFCLSAEIQALLTLSL